MKEVLTKIFILTFLVLLILTITEFENLSVEKKTNPTALGFEPRSFDCRSNAQRIYLYVYMHLHVMMKLTAFNKFYFIFIF